MQRSNLERARARLIALARKEAAFINVQIIRNIDRAEPFPRGTVREMHFRRRDYLQTRQSSGTVGNGAEGREGTGPLDRTPRTSMTMAMTTSALPMQPIYVPAGSCSAVDVPMNLQCRRLRQQQPQEPQELSLTRPTDTAESSSSIHGEPVRTPKRSSASHSSSSHSSKTPAISKSQMKGESRFKVVSLFVFLFIFFFSPIAHY